MFTGIITDVGTIESIGQHPGITKLVVKTNWNTKSIKVGDSIAVAGICLTVVLVDKQRLCFEVGQETIDKTTISEWVVGQKLNLEQSLRVGDTVDGYWYSGHIDEVAKITARKQDGESIRYKIQVPQNFQTFIAEKGSIALDGIALTINEVKGREFGVSIIPHTQKVTTANDWQKGDKLNFEVDILARYVNRLAELKG